MMTPTQPIIAFIDARIAELEAPPGARESTDGRIFELKLLRTYCENLDRGERMVIKAMSLLAEAAQ